MAQPSIRDEFQRSDFVLMGVCVVLAAGFLVLAGKNAASAGNFLTIDSLFFTSVCLLLALTFVAVPALTMRARGFNPLAVPEELTPARAADHVHFECGTRLFGNILLLLIAIKFIEVVLAD